VQSELDWGEEGSDQIPIAYRCQALWNMDVMGAQRCWFPILIRGAFYREYLIERDEAVEADMAILRDAGEKFIQSLIDDEPPSIDGHDATYRVLRERHPEIEQGDIAIDGGLADAYIAAVIQEKEIKEIKQRWAGEILQAMGNARNAIHSETEDRFAFRKPASNPDRTPYLMADPAVIKALRPALTIQGGKA
jgi:predicted phage-related endonuclease